MVAGRNGSGDLGPVTQMAFWLHDTEKNVAESLRTLETIGIVRRADDEHWIVTNFDKRQSKMPNKDKQSQYRERLRNALPETLPDALPSGYVERYVDVTTRNKHPGENRIEENRKEEEEGAQGAGAQGDFLKPGDLRYEAQNAKALSAQSKFPKDSEWPEMPDAALAERIFQQVTGMVTFPARSRAEDCERICSLYDRHKAQTVGYIQTFFEAWKKRGYNQVNTAWLDWAIAGQIPQARGNGRASGGNGRSASAPSDPALLDPVIREAVSYLKLNPNGDLREKNIERLKAKGFIYANNELRKLDGSNSA